MLLSAKEREEGARGLETVKVQLRSTLVSGFIHVLFLLDEALILIDLYSDRIHILYMVRSASQAVIYILLSGFIPEV